MFNKQKIKKARIGKGMSAQGLAERCGVDRQTIYSWESGKTQPTADRLVMLSEVLGKSIMYFFSWGQKKGGKNENKKKT